MLYFFVLPHFRITKLRTGTHRRIQKKRSVGQIHTSSCLGIGHKSFLSNLSPRVRFPASLGVGRPSLSIATCLLQSHGHLRPKQPQRKLLTSAPPRACHFYKLLRKHSGHFLGSFLEQKGQAFLDKCKNIKVLRFPALKFVRFLSEASRAILPSISTNRIFFVQNLSKLSCYTR